MMDVKPTELRRSCVFCRQRKMRCSGDLPCCITCRQREKPCVYEPVAFKNRSKRMDQSDEFANHDWTQVQQGYGHSQHMHQQSVGVDGDVKPGLMDQQQQQQHQHMSFQSTFQTANLIGEELSFFFATFCTAMQASNIPHDGKQGFCLPLQYATALPVLARDLVRLTVNKINNVNLDAHAPQAYLRSLMADNSTSTVAGLDYHDGEQWFAVNGPPSPMQIEQIIELAFNHHPLIALVIPKTPFLRNHHEDTSNHCLLWLLCGEGLELGMPANKPAVQTAYSLPAPQAFIQLAWKALFAHRQSPRPDSIWVSQALLLLGFRLLCQGHPKQATCFLLLCARSVSSMLAERSRKPPVEIKINGIRLSEVEDQAMNNIYWISHALLLWMWSQLPDRHSELATFVCPDTPINMPLPTTMLCASSLYKLEYVSGNFTSLNMHVSNGRSLTVLAHVCNMIHSLTPTSSDNDLWHSSSTMYAALSAKLLYNVKNTLTVGPTPLADEHASKAVMTAAYLFAIALCQPPSRNSCAMSQAELEKRCRGAFDVAKGMLRDCTFDLVGGGTHEGGMIRHFFTSAHAMLVRFFSDDSRESGTSSSIGSGTTTGEQQTFSLHHSLTELDRANGGEEIVTSATTPFWMVDLFGVMQEISKLAGPDLLYSGEARGNVIVPSAPVSPSSVQTAATPAKSARHHSVSSQHSVPNLQSAAFASAPFSARESSASFSPSSWQSLCNTTSSSAMFRARSFSDSAAIYCPVASNMPGLPSFGHSATSSYVPVSPSFTFEAGPGYGQGSSGNSVAFDSSASLTHRVRTPSLGDHSNLSDGPSTMHASNFYITSPPPPMQYFSCDDSNSTSSGGSVSTANMHHHPHHSTPSTDLTLLSETSSALQSVLHDYQEPHQQQQQYQHPSHHHHHHHHHTNHPHNAVSPEGMLRPSMFSNLTAA